MWKNRCVLAAISVAFLSAAATAAADGSPDETGGAPASPKDDDQELRRLVEQLQNRLDALEQRHAEERARDQERIRALESRIGELQDQDLESARQRAYEQQIAEIRAMIERRGLADAAMPPGENAAEDELAGLIGAQSAAQPDAATGLGAPAGMAGAIQGAIQSFNPEISLNGDFLLAYSNREGGEIDDEFLFRELEFGFSGAVDPYTRADVYVGLHGEGGDFHTHLEEAYLTYVQLPFNLQARFGKFRAEFGRANITHLHALPWIDYPFIIRRYFGEEGLFGTGAELSWLVPNPWDEYITLTYEVFNNDNDSLFAGGQSDDFTHLFHLKTFHELSKSSTLELGGSFATAPNDDGHGANRSMVEGLDVTYRWKPLGAGLYRSFLWQTELLFAQTDIRGGQETSWGMYSAAEYQFARRWKAGARYDYTQLPFSSSHHERGYSAYLTFLQSEFVFWRLGYLYTDRDFLVDGNKDDHQLFLQLNWSLGAHPAHKY